MSAAMRQAMRLFSVKLECPHARSAEATPTLQEWHPTGGLEWIRFHQEHTLP